jgi:hypothetical protein
VARDVLRRVARKKDALRDQEALLELGLVLLVAGLAAGASFWLAGRAWGHGWHARRHAAGAPPAGKIAPIRHQHIGSVAAR